MSPAVIVVIAHNINRNATYGNEIPAINKYINPTQNVRQYEQENGFGMCAFIFSHLDSEFSISDMKPDTSISCTIMN